MLKCSSERKLEVGLEEGRTSGGRGEREVKDYGNLHAPSTQTF